MARKLATVTSARVPATQTNFPIYIDQDRLGMTTLAEAQSGRWYTASDLVTEMAREVVSVTEGHGKHPSLTSTAQICIDWDGVRSDYATTATYGRNAVWSDYEFVAHNLISDSTGNGYDAASNNTGVAGSPKIGAARSFNGSNQQIVLPVSSTAIENSFGDFSVSVWMNTPSGQTPDSQVLGNYTGTSISPNQYWMLRSRSNGAISSLFRRDGNAENMNVTSDPINDGLWHHVVSVKDGKDVNLKVDSSDVGIPASFSTDGNTNNNRDVGMGMTYGRYYEGSIDEARIRKSVLSNNWITTEYNNQNANGSFWEATDAGGGAAAQAARRGVVMMM